jgi:hypothetical protein
MLCKNIGTDRLNIILVIRGLFKISTKQCTDLKARLDGSR